VLPIRIPTPAPPEPFDPFQLLDRPKVPETTLLAECRQLSTFRQVGGAKTPEDVRILYRIYVPPEEAGVVDMHGRSRWEGTYEALIEMVLRRKWRMDEIERHKLADRLHNFHYLFVNVADFRHVAEPALEGVLDLVGHEMDDAVKNA
jgi:hypothetical protein